MNHSGIAACIEETMQCWWRTTCKCFKPNMEGPRPWPSYVYMTAEVLQLLETFVILQSHGPGISHMSQRGSSTDISRNTCGCSSPLSGGPATTGWNRCMQIRGPLSKLYMMYVLNNT